MGDNQIRFLPPGIFTNNPNLTYLLVTNLQVPVWSLQTDYIGLPNNNTELVELLVTNVYSLVNINLQSVQNFLNLVKYFARRPSRLERVINQSIHSNNGGTKERL